MLFARVLMGVTWLVVPLVATASQAPADLIITDAKIYAVDAAHSMAEALAVRDGKIVYVGSAAGAKAWMGEKTQVESLGGQLVLPGLIDSHIHASAIADLDVCDLKNTAKSLRELSAFARACIEHYRVPEGQWLTVRQWNYFAGNQTETDYPTLRAALDKASTIRPIALIGSDGHHGAYNSVALSRARSRAGGMVGLSKATLAVDFSDVRAFVGVDADGEPNGAVNEDAKRLLQPPDRLAYLDEVMKAPERVTERLSSVGITAILDARVAPELLPFYDKLAAMGKLTVRATLAQFYDPEQFKGADGRVDYDRMVAQAVAVRTKYSGHPLIRANIVKLFADGGLEGNPYAVPPTMPNAAVLRPFYQPIFGRDAKGELSVIGYVDPTAPVCIDVRAHPSLYSSTDAVARFLALHHYHPGQCAIDSGRLYHDRAVIMEFVRRFHAAGFGIHIHAISTQALRTGLDAIEAARAADGVQTIHDAFAHVQLADPEDVKRLGRDHIYVAFTYCWAITDPNYDMTVVPFFVQVAGNGYQALHRPSYYEANAYPFRAVKQAGGILVAGSDAPVETPDPRPFFNMAIAITRADAGEPPLNPAQSITVREVIDAYTIDGARYLDRDRTIGSLEVGKSADFIVLDRDILALADAGHPADIAGAQVLETWFMGKSVYRRAH